MAASKSDTKSKSKPSGKYLYSVGRRKTATATCRLYSGKGETLVNSLPVFEYFPGPVAKMAYLKPFQVTDTINRYHAVFLVKGSGKNSQLGAVVHALSRALDQADHEAFHTLLKKSGLLTRDPRARERRKIGQMGRARKKKQSPKR